MRCPSRVDHPEHAWVNVVGESQTLSWCSGRSPDNTEGLLAYVGREVTISITGLVHEVLRSRGGMVGSQTAIYLTDLETGTSSSVIDARLINMVLENE